MRLMCAGMNSPPRSFTTRHASLRSALMEVSSSRSSRRMKSPVSSTTNCSPKKSALFSIWGRWSSTHCCKACACSSVSNRHSTCTSSRVCSSMPGSTTSPLPSAAFCTALMLAVALWSVMAIRRMPWSTASCTISGGIISIPAQGERTVWTCRSARQFCIAYSARRPISHSLPATSNEGLRVESSTTSSWSAFWMVAGSG